MGGGLAVQNSLAPLGGGDRRTSSFYGTVQGAKHISDETKAQAAANRATDYEYDVKHNVDTIRQAYYDFTSNYEGSVARLYEKLGSNIELTAEDIAGAAALASKLDSEGNKTGAAELLTKTRKKLTNYGQVMQAVKLFEQVGSAAQTETMRLMLEDAGITPPAGLLDHIGNLTQEAKNAYNGGNADVLYQMIEDIAKERGYKVRSRDQAAMRRQGLEWAYSAASSQIQGLAIDEIPPSRGRKISTFQAMAHLLSGKTIMRNLVSNEVFDLVDTVANNIAILPDAIIAAFQGGTIKQNRTVGFEKSWLSKGKRTGAAEAAARAALDINLDMSAGSSPGKYSTGTHRTFNRKIGNTNITNPLNIAEGALGYGLTWTDEFHKGGIRGESQEALRPLVESGGRVTQEMADRWSEERALYKSFQDKTIAGQVLQSVKNALNVVGIGDSGRRTKIGNLKIHDFGVGDFVQKYPKVPGALITRAVEYSPLGYAKFIYDLSVMGMANRQGKRGRGGAETKTAGRYTGLTNAEVSVEAQRNAALDIARATTGTGMITLFVSLLIAGITSMSDDEDKNISAVDRAEGLTGTQINLSALGRWIEGGSTELQKGDQLYSLDFLEPINSLMAIGARVAKLGEDAGALDYVGQTIDGIFDSISALPTMTTLQTINNNITYRDEDESALDIAGNIGMDILAGGAAGFIPAPVRQAAQGLDQVYRDTSADTARQELVNSLIAGIPFARENLPARLDSFGNERAYGDNEVVNWLNAVLSPGSINTYRPSDVSSELAAIYEATGASNIYPKRSPPRTVNYEGEDHELTTDERRQYQQTYGQTYYSLLTEFFNSDAYSVLSAEMRADIAANMQTYATAQAKQAVSDYEPDGWIAKAQEFSGGAAAFILYRDAWNNLMDSGGESIDGFDALYEDYKSMSPDMRENLKALLGETSRFDGLIAAREAGLSTRQWYDAYDKWGQLDDTGNKAGHNAQQFELWMDNQSGLMGIQKRTLREQFKFYTQIPGDSQKYDELKGAGLSVLTSDRIYRAVSSMPGDTSEEKAARYAEIVSLGLNDADTAAALTVYEAAAAGKKQKFATAYNYGIPPSMYVEVLRLKTEDENNSITKSEATAIANRLDATTEQKAVIWAMLVGSNTKSGNPFGYYYPSTLDWVYAG